tara:strand:+ start:51 stop:767 length:717 start_codon:yes stop_codon:yes gene_type:complete
MADAVQLKRKVVLDTETTGLDPNEDKIIEVGCIELIDDIPSGEKYHRYFNPGNKIISEQSEKIHGLNNQFLKKFPSFESQITEFVSFLSDSEILIHNVAFDLSIINSHFTRAGYDLIDESQCTCTLELAKKNFPGSKVNLNALCRRFNISLESRKTHGALTDCFLLAQVYLELIGGRQTPLQFLNTYGKEVTSKDEKKESYFRNTLETPTICPSKEDNKKHHDLIEKLKNPIWRKLKS